MSAPTLPSSNSPLLTTATVTSNSCPGTTVSSEASTSTLTPAASSTASWKSASLISSKNRTCSTLASRRMSWNRSRARTRSTRISLGRSSRAFCRMSSISWPSASRAGRSDGSSSARSMSLSVVLLKSGAPESPGTTFSTKFRLVYRGPFSRAAPIDCVRCRLRPSIAISW